MERNPYVASVEQCYTELYTRYFGEPMQCSDTELRKVKTLIERGFTPALLNAALKIAFASHRFPAEKCRLIYLFSEGVLASLQLAIAQRALRGNPDWDEIAIAYEPAWFEVASNEN